MSASCVQPQVCALCLQQKVLRKSHVLPNAVFRRIKRSQNSGQLIYLHDSEHAPIGRSQKSWWEHLLCASCEHIVGGYEAYGLSLIRESNRAQKQSDGVTFRNHDYARFKLFLLSVLWRSAVSQQPEFSKVVLPNQCKELARTSLLGGRPLPPLRLGCKLLRMVDDTQQADGGFSYENLEHLVISPIPRFRAESPKRTYVFLFEGFLLEYFVPTVPYKQSKSRGIHNDSPIVFVPFRSIFKIPEVVRLLVSAYGKHRHGVTRL